MWKSAYVGVYQLLNWKMHGETLNLEHLYSKINFAIHFSGDHSAMLCGRSKCELFA